MWSEFYLTWNSHLGSINKAKNQIELLNKNTQPVHLAPCCTGPTKREFGKSEIEKMLAWNIIEPAQAEWATATAIAPKVNGTLRFFIG